MVCSNGLVRSSGVSDEIRVRHVGYDDLHIESAAQKLALDVPKMMQEIDNFNLIALTEQERIAYAESAIEMSFDNENYKIDPKYLIRSYRQEEKEPTLRSKGDTWRYNRYDGTPLEFVTKLREWNDKSVKNRYKNTDFGVLDEYKPKANRILTDVELYKILSSVEYQSCEIDSWDSSQERLCLTVVQRNLTEDSIRNTPEFQAARW